MRYQRDLKPGPDWTDNVLILWEAYETYDWFMQTVARAGAAVLGSLVDSRAPSPVLRDQSKRSFYLTRNGWVFIHGPYYAAVGVVVRDLRGLHVPALPDSLLP
jgi:hypothetical protein